MAKYPKYKVAAVQAAPVYLDLDASVDKAIGFTARTTAQDSSGRCRPPCRATPT